jgi:tetratricopeptide (TPR) repeat protein
VAEQPTQPGGVPRESTRPSWRSSWQMPALVGSLLLLAGGTLTAFLTAPKPDFDRMLSQAQVLLEGEKYIDALEGLNSKIGPYAARGNLSLKQQAEFHTLRGRAIYLGQQHVGVDLGANARTVLDEFNAAKAAGATLEGRDVFSMADAWITLGDYARALDLAAQLPEKDNASRGRIYKRIVEQQLRDPANSGDVSLRLLADFLKDPALPAPDRAWALSRQVQLLRRRGLVEESISKLVQTMPSLLDRAGPEALGELHLLLGRAYLETGALPEAARQLSRATELLLQTDERWATATVLLGRVEEMTRPPDEARSEARAKYRYVIERFAGSEARLPALLALGELEGSGRERDEVEASVAAYGELVRELQGGRKHPELSVPSVTASLLERAVSRSSQQDHEGSLRFGELAERMYLHESVPAEVLMALASSHRLLAEEMLQVKDGRGALALARLDPATREQARLHLLSAGAYYRRHADRVGIADNASFGRSLWLSADSYDLAGEPEQAMALFGDYVKYFPGDARQPEARYRLGQAYQARGEYVLGAEQYRTLLHAASSEDPVAGPLADLSAVPLAQCLLLDPDPANDVEAEALLWQVVRGKLGAAGTEQYRDALMELAALESRRGDFAGAIQNLEEAVARYPDDERIGMLLYNLADAYRQDARSIARTLQEALPDSRKQLLTETRIQRLRKAQELFDRARETLESRDPRHLTSLETLQLRNASFFAADCAFDQGNYEQAIRRYDAARERYPKDPASLVAMIQIVNAYVEMGDQVRAATANERAKLFYRSLPATAWEDPSLPISVQDWQRWLDSMSMLKPLGSRTTSVPVKEDQP